MDTSSRIRPLSRHVSADTVTGILHGDGWRSRANWIREGKDGLRALVGVHAGLNLLVEAMDVEGNRDELWIEAWSGEPEDFRRYEDSDGIAVIGADGVPDRLAVIPLCGCGIRGCGNSGVQLVKQLPDNELFDLVQLLRGLPWSDERPTYKNVLRGDGLAALSERTETVSPSSKKLSRRKLRGMPLQSRWSIRLRQP
jgi:hypothetical protein